jgi:hypothetical protein
MRHIKANAQLSILAFSALAARLVFLLFNKLDSDEPQHLHVAWAWSRGLVQYRDVFDNHLPLLHLLFAPLVPLLPESSGAFFWARLAIAPFALAASVLLFVIARPAFGTRTALLAAVLFSVLPPWLPKSVEFRNDTLWILFWLAAIASLVVPRRPNALAAGFFGALCLLSSIKALPLFLAHALALLSDREPVQRSVALRVAIGAATPLLVMVVVFTLNGAFADAWRATVLLNASLPISAARRVSGGVAFAILAPVLTLHEHTARVDHALRFAFWYVTVLLCLWPLIGPRDFLPLVPLLAIAIAKTRVAERAPALVMIAAVVASIHDARLLRPRPSTHEAFVDAVVASTSTGDYVFDLKGDAVFRPRPVHEIYDVVGRALTRNGTLPDRGPEQIIATGCCVAIEDSADIPARTRAFLNAHFLKAGAIRICGTNARHGRFSIAVPQTYEVAASHEGIVIDGVPYSGPRFLAAGEHTINRDVTITWRRHSRSLPRSGSS